VAGFPGGEPGRDGLEAVDPFQGNEAASPGPR
jgi:hypothetical protein